MTSAALLALLALSAPAQDAAGGDEFFEKRIRPVLVERCYSCHSEGAAKLKGNLKLDTREGTRKGGDLGPAVVPGDLERSLLIKAIRFTDDELKMPPKKPLGPDQIADFETWVRSGAPDPRAGSTARPGADAARRHWAFRPPAEVPPPAVALKAWPANGLDRFILAKLEEKGLRPSPPADPRTLIRRATYDLCGLPPSPEEVEAFVANPDFPALVERLLASPAYGERWGRHWLDVARYADTKGYVYEDRDEKRFVHAWAYRDWVVRAFNDDVPYGRFLMLQLAADRMEAPASELAAMGFLTVGRRFINNIHDIIDDRIDTMGRGMMGLTISCARCHDHKFDPIPTADYYSLYGVFSGSSERSLAIADATDAAYLAELKKRQDALVKLFEKKRDALLDRLRRQTAMYLAATTAVEKLPTEEFYQLLNADEVNPVVARAWHLYLLKTRNGVHPVFGAWNAFAAKRPLPTEGLHPAVAAAFAEAPASIKEAAERYARLLLDAKDPVLRDVLYGPASPIAMPTGAISEVEWFFDEGTRVELAKAQREIERWVLDSPASPPQASILEDRPQPATPRVFRRGNPANKGDEVPRQFLGLLAPDRKPFADGSGRLELAKAVADPANPLTNRVWVNRVWMNHFGAGLMRTPSDFGLRSEAPSHPELLDWLARRFADGGGSTKQLHRLILLSATYRQSSEDQPAARALDPDNRLLWRMNRRRLDWESMRDSFLAVSGRLDPARGGRPAPIAGTRRSIYGFVDRLNVPGVLRAFDFASVDAHSPQRFQTTVPQQALFLLNSPFMVEQARALAARPEIAAAKDPVVALTRLLFGRDATPEELELGRAFLAAPAPPPIAWTRGAWRYGYGAVDEATKKVSAFTEFPHFTGKAWQGGAAWPDPTTGWAMLDAQGGHAGNDLAHATIRRWIAPQDGVVSVSGTIAHKPKGGNGIRARLISSGSGELATWTLKQLEAETKLKGLAVKKGETIDFVVDFHGEISYDEFVWSPLIQLAASATPAGASINPAEAGAKAGEWNAGAQFGGPPPRPLSPLEQYAQTLMLTNEFLFLD